MGDRTEHAGAVDLRAYAQQRAAQQRPAGQCKTARKLREHAKRARGEQPAGDPQRGFRHRQQPVRLSVVDNFIDRRDHAGCAALDGKAHQRGAYGCQEKRRTGNRNGHRVTLDAIDMATALAIANCASRSLMSKRLAM